MRDEPPAANDFNLNAVALHFLGLLLLLGGVLLLVILAAMFWLPTEGVDRALVYILPGGGHRVIDPTVLTILAAASGFLAAMGCLGLVSGRLFYNHGPRPATAMPRSDKRPTRRPMLTLLAGATFLVMAVVLRWHWLNL